MSTRSADSVRTSTVDISAPPSVSKREASGGEDDSMLGSLKNSRSSANAYLFRDLSQKTRAFEKTSPAGFYQLAVCLHPHTAEVVHDGRRVHAGPIPRGGVNLYTPGEHISVNTRAPWEMLVLFLGERLFQTVCDEASFPPETHDSPTIINPRFQMDPSILSAGTRIARAVLSSGPFDLLRMDLASQEIAVQLLSAHSDLRPGLSKAIAKPYARGLAPWQLNRAYEALSDLQAKDISLVSLADAAGCSATHFARAFKVSTGQTPFQWLLERRIDRAKDLLRTPGRPLSDIALEVGFAAQPQFTTAFKRVTGLTPGDWRKEAMM